MAKNDKNENKNENEEGIAAKIANVVTGGDDKKTSSVEKIEIEIPDGVNMRDPKTKKLIKDPKDLKAVKKSVPKDTFWIRRVMAGDVIQLGANDKNRIEKRFKLNSRR